MAVAAPRPGTGAAFSQLLVPTTGDRNRGSALPDALRARFGADLPIPVGRARATVVANFVSTIDGVVSFGVPDATGGGEISGYFEPDRFLMGLLRALADVVLIGAGTLRAAPHGSWTAASIHPASAGDFSRLRAELGLSSEPRTVVVLGSGPIDLGHPGLREQAERAVVATTDARARALQATNTPAGPEIVGVGTDRVDPAGLIELLEQRGAGLVLCEGGPHLIGQLLDADRLTELFLTIAPQVAGRAASTARLGLVEGTAFDLDRAPWARLIGLARVGDHLFTRYRFESEAR